MLLVEWKSKITVMKWEQHFKYFAITIPPPILRKFYFTCFISSKINDHCISAPSLPMVEWWSGGVVDQLPRGSSCRIEGWWWSVTSPPTPNQWHRTTACRDNARLASHTPLVNLVFCVWKTSSLVHRWFIDIKLTANSSVTQTRTKLLPNTCIFSMWAVLSWGHQITLQPCVFP